MNPVFVFLVAMIWIVSSIASKKKKEEMRKKTNQQPPPGSSQNNPGSPKAATVSRSTNPSPSVAPLKNSTAGRGMDSKWPWPTAAEKAASSKEKTASSGSYGGTPRYTHVVTSTLEGGHTHTESSMTGEEACPPPKVAAVKPPETGKSPATETGTLLNFQPSNVLQGVLYAEILGKPKSLQRH